MKENKKRISVVVEKKQHEDMKEVAKKVADGSVSRLLRTAFERFMDEESKSREIREKLKRIESKVEELSRHLGLSGGLHGR